MDWPSIVSLHQRKSIFVCSFRRTVCSLGRVKSTYRHFEFAGKPRQDEMMKKTLVIFAVLIVAIILCATAYSNYSAEQSTVILQTNVITNMNTSIGENNTATTPQPTITETPVPTAKPTVSSTPFAGPPNSVWQQPMITYPPYNGTKWNDYKATPTPIPTTTPQVDG